MRIDFGHKLLIQALWLCLACPIAAQPAAAKKFELRVVAGLSMTQIRGSAIFADVWNQGLLSKINEQNLFSLKSDNVFFLGAYVSYYFRPGYGLEAGLGFFKSGVPDTTSFHSEYLWTSGKNETLTRAWTGMGSLRVIPISLNGVRRWQTGKIEISVSGGPTLFLTAFQSRGLAGFSVSEIAYVQTFDPPETTVIQSVDALPVNLAVERYSWAALGANMGAGVVYKVSNKVGLTAGVRYFLCPKKEFVWSWMPGIYDGINSNITDWEFTNENARYAEERMKPPLTVNPSFFQLGLGVQVDL